MVLKLDIRKIRIKKALKIFLLDMMAKNTNLITCFPNFLGGQKQLKEIAINES